MEDCVLTEPDPGASEQPLGKSESNHKILGFSVSL
jgi:hypothetical protein